MTSNDLLVALKGMIHHKSNRITLGRPFEDLGWKKNVSFHDYVHEEVILANGVAVSDEDIAIVRYIIEGITDPHLRDLAQV